jgi:L-lactate dehydrogenase complex protein LldE
MPLMQALKSARLKSACDGLPYTVRHRRLPPMKEKASLTERPPRVGLFVTCLVDLLRPSVGFAAVKLLEDAGCLVDAPLSQTCCGQPGYNSGDRHTAAEIALQVIDLFDPYDFIVAPSGSCAGMLRKHYPALFAEGTPERMRAERFSGRCYELISFLADVRGVETIAVPCRRSVTYHDSCSGLRELGVRTQPRRLLASMPGLALKELHEADVCCGFGGTFCVKYPAISNAMVEHKVANIEKSGADLLLAGDLGCLLNMAGKLTRSGSNIEVRHVAEVLAGDTSEPPIAGANRP